VCKKLIKNSQPFGKKCQKTAGGGLSLTHTVVCLCGLWPLQYHNAPVHFHSICHNWSRINDLSKL